MTVTEAPNVSSAIETSDKVASHLHPTPSYDLADHPVPTGREEIWRFTPLKRLGGILEGEASDARLTWRTELPEGVTLREISAEEARGLGEMKPADRPSALAVANAGGAMLLDVPAELELAEPIVVTLHGSTPEDLVWGHLVVRVGNHAKAAVVLEHTGAARYAATTSVPHRRRRPGHRGHHPGLGRRRRPPGSRRDPGRPRRLGAALRDQLRRVWCASTPRSCTTGPAARPSSSACTSPTPGQHLEHRLFVDHNAPKTRSNVDYKGALQGQGAHAVWIGDVLIRKAAEGIETYESNRNLVLTDGCRADSVPNLEIETGEIEGAGHASTTGRFDDQQLFYLQSRGIAEDEARRLVVHGFFADIIRKIGVPALEERLLATVEAELEKNVGANPSSVVTA